MKKNFALLLSALLLVGCGGNASQKDKAEAVLNSFNSKNPKAINKYVSDKFVQHDLSLMDGKAGLIAAIQDPSANVKVKVVRSFEDEAFAVTHSEISGDIPQVSIDVFRFEEGKIVEQWNNKAALSENPNAAGHTQLDGTTEVTNLNDTAANKELVKAYIEQVIIGKNLDEINNFVSEETYVDHSEKSQADGVEALKAELTETFKGGSADRLHLVLGQGNFVLAIVEGVMDGKPVASFSLFRVDAGKIVEHWGTYSEIIPGDPAKNPNNKF